MGKLAKVLSVEKTTRGDTPVTDVKVDTGGGANATCEQYADDQQPLPGDFAVVVEIQRTGGKVVVGYLDPKNANKTEPGERRLYSRDSDGNEKCQLWIKNDGSLIISNDNVDFNIGTDGSISGDNGSGNFSLGDDGTFTVNGVTIDPNGNIDTPADIQADGKINSDDDVTAGNISLTKHTHPGVQSGGGSTGPAQ